MHTLLYIALPHRLLQAFRSFFVLESSEAAQTFRSQSRDHKPLDSQPYTRYSELKFSGPVAASPSGDAGSIHAETLLGLGHSGSGIAA